MYVCVMVSPLSPQGNAVPALEVAVVSLYIDPPLSRTDALVELQSQLPDWVDVLMWTSSMDVWQF